MKYASVPTLKGSRTRKDKSTIPTVPSLGSDTLISNAGDDYLRPGGVDTYRRPGGVDTYKRP